jgi:hypothetical protein
MQARIVLLIDVEAVTCVSEAAEHGGHLGVVLLKSGNDLIGCHV